MQSSMPHRKNAIKAVITIFAGLLILSLFIVALGGHRFWEEQDTYVINFRSIRDLAERRPVKYAGLTIGRVLDIQVAPDNPGEIAVEIGVEQGFPLFEGTQATISQKGLVGDNYVLLELYGDPGRRLVSGDHIPAAPSADFREVLGAMHGMVGTLTPKLETIADSLIVLVNPENQKNVALTLENAPKLLAQAQATLDRIDGEIASLSTETRTTLRDGQQVMASMQSHLDTTMTKVNTAVDTAVGDWSSTLADVRVQVNTVGGRIDSLTKTLESSLDYDQEQLEVVLENVDELVTELRKLSRSLRERPWQVIYHPEERALQ